MIAVAGQENASHEEAGEPSPYTAPWDTIRHGVAFHIAVDKARARANHAPMDWDQDLDATGLICPLPVLKARKRLQALEQGRVLRLVADDPAAVIDVPHFCAEQGYELIRSTREGAAQVYLIRKA